MPQARQVLDSRVREGPTAALQLARQEEKTWSTPAPSERAGPGRCTVVTSTSGLTKPVRDTKATWVEPKFLGEVESQQIHCRLMDFRRIAIRYDKLARNFLARRDERFRREGCRRLCQRGAR